MLITPSWFNFDGYLAQVTVIIYINVYLRFTEIYVCITYRFPDPISSLVRKEVPDFKYNILNMYMCVFI